VPRLHPSGGHIVSVCRSCGAEILWAITVTNSRMPVDPTPVPDGNVVLTRIDGGTPVATVLAPGEMLLDSPPLYVSHFVTCPQADQWRKDK
jgi:hypothetical protein